MSHPSKAKGNGFEREIVAAAQAIGLSAKRAWGSNGNALGCAETVDVLVDKKRVQAKRRGRLPAYLKIPDGCDVVAFREDRGESYVLMTLGDWLGSVKALSEQTTKE